MFFYLIDSMQQKIERLTNANIALQGDAKAQAAQLQDQEVQIEAQARENRELERRLERYALALRERRADQREEQEEHARELCSLEHVVAAQAAEIALLRPLRAPVFKHSGRKQVREIQPIPLHSV